MGTYKETKRTTAESFYAKYERDRLNKSFLETVVAFIGFLFWTFIGSLILLALFNLFFTVAFGWSFLAVNGWNIYGLAALCVVVRMIINVLRGAVFKAVK